MTLQIRQPTVASFHPTATNGGRPAFPPVRTPMRTPKTLATSLLTLSAAALLALSPAGAATASPNPAKTPLSASDVASHTVTEAGAADYWTSERMRNAVPGDVLAARAMARGGKSSKSGSAL